MFDFVVRRERALLITMAQLLVIIGLSVLAGRAIHLQLSINHSRSSARQLRVGEPIPYTVVRRETYHRPDGSVTAHKDSTEAIRSDGSRVVQNTPIRNPANGVERIIMLASGTQVIINDLVNLKSTVAMNINFATLQRDPSSKCMNSFAGKPFFSTHYVTETIQGEELVSGYRAIHIEASDGITRWLALDYGCAVLKERWDHGAGRGYSEHNLVTLIPGEPDAALFHVPANAKEVPPSELVKATYLNHNNCQEPKCIERLNERLRQQDKNYYSRRPTQ
jgi:hypothetical protein